MWLLTDEKENAGTLSKRAPERRKVVIQFTGRLHCKSNADSEGAPYKFNTKAASRQTSFES